MKSNNSVTVLMPVYNGGKYLRFSIDSILSQSHRDFEFLIINDGSTDDSEEIILSFNDSRIRYIKNQINIGMIATLNLGLTLASHDLIARQDADDISYPKRLERQMELMLSDDNMALVGARADEIDENGCLLDHSRFEKPSDHVSIKWYLLFDNPFIHSSVIYKKEIALHEFGGYQCSDWCGDYDLWSKIALEYPVANHTDRLVSYRVHKNSLIGSIPTEVENENISMRENIAIIKSNLDSIYGQDIYGMASANTLRLFINGVSRESSSEFMYLFRTLLNGFIKMHPESKYSEDFKRTVASQLSLVAYKLIPENRVMALSIYKYALKIFPRYFTSLPLMRVLFLMLFGDTGRKYYQRVKNLIQAR